ncbi:MAG TPA: NADH-quinone oxidoreductase subunit J [Opitutus sp.]|jgi:NADH-quinone oxidoreductase subunit J|nr:NADH-quinone oxidoreductase subunit J [Opitutus sp.]
MSPLLFNIFALLTVIAAVATVLNKNAVNAAMCFMLSLVGVAGLFVMLEAYLLAFVLVLVYAGAVAALFLFIVMLLNVQQAASKPFKKMTLVASTVAAALLAVGVLAFYRQPELTTGALSAAPAVGASLKDYSYQLFTTYLLPVQIIGFLLLIAMLGVIVLSRKMDNAEPAS